MKDGFDGFFQDNIKNWVIALLTFRIIPAKRKAFSGKPQSPSTHSQRCLPKNPAVLSPQST